MVLQPASFREGEDVVWRLIWAAWQRLWKEDHISCVDALQASSSAKSTMGTYCNRYRKLALWVGYTLIDDLETEACTCLFQLRGLGYSWRFLRGAVSAMRALEEMGWLPEFVNGRVWRCAKCSTSQAVARLYAGLEELRGFARACDGRAQWTVYGMAVLSFTCLYGWARQPPSGVECAAAGDWGFTPSSVTHTSSGGGWGARAGCGCDGWTVRGPCPQSHWHTSARKGPPTSRWSWQPPSVAAREPTRDGTRGGGVGRQPYARWGYRSDGLPGGVVGCLSWWRPTTAMPQTTSSWQSWSGSGALYSLKTSFLGGRRPSVCGIRMWGQKKTSGAGGVGMQTPSPGHTAVSEGTGRSKEVARMRQTVVGRADERVPLQAGARGSRVPLRPLRLSRDARGLSVKVNVPGERRRH